MPTAANTSRFTLQLKQLELLLAADDFIWQQELASDDYLKVTVRSETALSLETLLKQPVCFSIQGEQNENYFHGIITQAQSIGITPDQKEYVYAFLLRSPLCCMQNTKQSRVFLNLSVIDLLEQLLQEAGFSASQYYLDLNAVYPKRDCLIQLNETDFDFFQRQLKHWGLFYCWQQDSDNFKLIITDHLAALDKNNTTANLSYEPLSGTERANASIFYYQTEHALLVSKLRLRDYNPAQPELGLLLESKSKRNTDVANFGQDYRYGEHLLSDDENEFFLNIRQQMLDWQRQVVKFFTDCSDIKLGQRLHVTNCVIEELNRDYHVIGISQFGNQDAGRVYAENETPLSLLLEVEMIGDKKCHPQLTYHNHIICIPAEVPYRPLVSNQKIYHGYFTATVTKQPNVANKDEENSTEAHLNEDGSYYVKFDFDSSSNAMSPPLRLAQPYAGSEFGWHFPLTPGATVLGAFENGDPDRPILLGALPSETAPSPVNANNPWQHVIHTPGDHTFLLDDSPGQEKIELTTPNRAHLLQLSAPQDVPPGIISKIQLRTEYGTMDWQALQAITVTSGNTVTQKIGQSHHITVAKEIQTQTAQGNLELQANRMLQLKSKQNFDWQAEQGSMSFRSGEQTILSSGDGMDLKSECGDICFTSSSGNIAVNGTQGIILNAQGKGAICFAQSGAMLKINPDGSLYAKASCINIFSEQNNAVGVPGQAS
jgi:type VI secretion system secreted protein VgrG